MQFKYPFFLYFLCFLLVPILVHLFQLQKFKKTLFTNVAFLQKLALETRKSSQLKKWLILITRLLLFIAIIIAFSQPYFSNKSASKKTHTFIYLDNSLSLDSKGEKGNLFQNSIKEIIENSPEKEIYSLLTNTNFHEKISKSELKNILLNLKPTSKNSTLSAILLKIEAIKNKETNTSHNSILISDFQNNTEIKNSKFTNVTSPISFIKLNSKEKNNLSIDSVFISDQNNNNFSVNISIKNQGSAKKNIPITIFNNGAIVTKQTFSIKENEEKNILFPIQNQQKFNGKIQLNFDDVFNHDNSFYFALNSTKKINTLSIGNKADFLSKIYTKREFNFSQSSLKNINYNSIQKQELIILNELNEIPKKLANSLEAFLISGGSISIIPATNININSYNTFFRKIGIQTIVNSQKDSLKITSIIFKHPFFKNVFSKKIKNFQYPFAKNSYKTNFKKQSSLIRFENQKSFINQIKSKNGNVFWVSSPLSSNNSNFTSSPLIVPVFYNFGKLSIKNPETYYTLEKRNTIDIATKLAKNEVLSMKKNAMTFIPQQQTFLNKVTIHTFDQPKENGLYSITNKSNTIETVAYNYDSTESLLNFIDVKTLIKDNKNLNYNTSIKNVFQSIKKKNEVTWLWKWFLALAIVSLFFEILILKLFKP